MKNKNGWNLVIPRQACEEVHSSEHYDCYMYFATNV